MLRPLPMKKRQANAFPEPPEMLDYSAPEPEARRAVELNWTGRNAALIQLVTVSPHRPSRGTKPRNRKLRRVPEAAGLKEPRGRPTARGHGTTETAKPYWQDLLKRANAE